MPELTPRGRTSLAPKASACGTLGRVRRDVRYQGLDVNRRGIRRHRGYVPPMTVPEPDDWPAVDLAGHTRSEVSAVVGRDDVAWARASRDVLCWRVKTRSGFAVSDEGPVRVGARQTITFRILGITVREPVEVVEVHQAPDRVGFSYRTRPGHPVSGEEAFVVSRDGDDVVLTVRSLTAPSPRQPWRAAFPVLRIAQRFVRRRYLRALRADRD